MLLDKIPGLKRAEARAIAEEERIRRQAFLPCCLRICGLNVRPFTPRHYILLDEARSPLIGYGGDVLPEHVYQFLWLVSTEFVLPTHQLPLREVTHIRQRFFKSAGRVKYLPARKQIKRYLDDAFFDAPPGDGGSSQEAPYASFAAHLVMQFHPRPAAIYDAKGQPVPEGGTLDTPFAQLFQLTRVMNMKDPDYCPPNRLSDRVVREHVKRYFDRQKARRKKA